MSDNWNFYFTNAHGKPASIFLDLGLAKDPPRDRYPEMVWVRVYMLRPREDGLSSQEEYDDLCKIDDAVEAAADPAGAVYVGRKTGARVRDYFFYAPNGERVRAAAALALQAFPAYEHKTGGQADPKWDLYFELLYPSPVDLQIMANRNVLDALERQGDDLKTPRMIEHWIGFPDELSRHRFLEHAAAQGFAIANSYQAESGDKPFFIVVGRDGAPAHIDKINIPLFEAARQFGGEYDGWETKVMKSDEAGGGKI